MSDTLPTPARFRAGCAQTVITPPLGVSLAGYFHDRIATEVRDDLLARAVVVEGAGGRVALISCDLISMTAEISDPAKGMIAQETGIPADHVLICATHTHTGPEIRANGVVPRLPEYAAELPRKIADAVRQAAESMFDATLRPGRTTVEGYSFNRLFRLQDAQEVFGSRGRKDVIAPAGPIDPELQTLSFVDSDGQVRAVVANFALHPDVIGGGSGTSVSADWPGEIGRNLKAIYGVDTVFVFLQGTAGDINHNPHSATHLPIRGPEKSVQLGRALAGAILYAAERAEPMSAGDVAAALQSLSVPYYTRDAALLAEIDTLRAKDNRSPFEEYLLQRTEEWPYDGQTASVPVHCLRIGDVGIVGLPAEIFVRLGLEIKQYSPFDYTFVVELANDRVSTYVPTTDQAERNAYGAKPILSRWLCADAGRRMVDAAIPMLYRLSAHSG